ncbi:MAG: hypothetical protein ACRDYA_07755 [Egibacteraceae bacterium]
MKNRRLIALVVAAVLFGAATAAYADHAYTARARAVGLTLRMQDQGLTAALTDAKVQSGRIPGGEGCADNTNACATAAGLAEPLGKSAQASAPGNQGSKTAPATNLTPTGTTLLSKAITARIGQSTAVAMPPADTKAKGTAGQSIVSLNLGQQIPAAETVQQRIRTEVPAIVDGLAAIAEDDPSGRTRRIADGLELIAQNPAAQPLVEITTGPALSESSDLDDKTTATAIANGAEVVIGPVGKAALPGATPEGFIVLRISKSMATATTDQKTGKADFTPPEVTVVSLADVGLDKVNIAPGQSNCFAVNTPFETCVTVSSGAKRVEGAAAAATVGGVEVSALRTQGKSAVNLRLGVVDAGVNAAGRKVNASSPESAPDSTPEPSAPAPEPARGPTRVLPKTGSANLTVPGLVLLGASGITLALLRRRHI